MSNALSSWGSVDPELLNVRLSALTAPREREQVGVIVNGSFACLTKIGGIDFAGLERATGGKSARELWAGIEGSVGALWLAVEELQHTLDPLIQEHQMRLGDDSTDITFNEVETAPVPKKDGQGPRPTLTPLQRIGETAWATSFVLSGEIQTFRKRLPMLLKVPDAWELLGELQDHLGHVKAAINAILTGVFSSLPHVSDDATADAQNLELVVSRELRSRVFELRDTILAVEAAILGKGAAEWQPHLLEAHAAIEKFMFGPGFAWMRAGDKRTFIKQHRQLGELLELWSPLRAMPARHSVQNLARYLEALEVINQRECLVLHDRDQLRTVVRQMGHAANTEGPERREAIGKALAALSEAQGRDRDLDTLLEQTLAPGTPVPVAQILERAGALLRQLGG